MKLAKPIVVGLGLLLVGGVVFAVVTVEDHRGEETVCELHQVSLETSIDRIGYGMIVIVEYPPDVKARFPHAKRGHYHGIGTLLPKWALTRHCLECDEVRAATPLPDDGI